MIVSFVLGFQAQHDNAGMLLRRVCPNIGEIQIEGEQNPGLGSHAVCDRFVIRSRQGFVPHGFDIETRPSQCCRSLQGKVLVCLEFQAVSSSGSSIVPSRANSAAYASTASTSSGLSEG